MKKTIAAILILSLTVIFCVGCGTSIGPPDNGGPSTPAVSSPGESAGPDGEDGEGGESELSYVGMIFPMMNQEWWINMADEIKAPLEARGIQVEVASSDDDHAKQLELVENFVSKGVDGLILFPIGASDIGGTLEKCQQQGIRVVVIVNSVDKGYDAMLMTNYADVGASCARMAADWIDETFPDAGPGSVEVGMITITMSPESKLTSETMALVTEFTDKAKIVDSYDLAFNDPPTKAQDSAEMMFGGHPDVKCILVYSSALATGVDEVVLRTPGIDLSRFAIFTNTYSTGIGERIVMSRTNESLIRGVNITGTGSYGYVADALLGALPLDDNKLYYDVVTDITTDNVDDFLSPR
ncbi:MAG: substrate-binding domain-containing protein [Peptococcaceae bacterium]|jgi:ABC-type sugar transport system substrate-binding protein|nr:substrate-binding domain-containing protein [Peptococcaceae bacterium]